MTEIIDKTNIGMLETLFSGYRGEFVQVYLGGANNQRVPILALSGDLPNSYVDILRAVLDGKKIPYENVSSNGAYGPRVRSKDGSYEAVGAGTLSFNEKKCLYLFGKSFEYGLAPNKEHADELLTPIKSRLNIIINNRPEEVKISSYLDDEFI